MMMVSSMERDGEISFPKIVERKGEESVCVCVCTDVCMYIRSAFPIHVA
jgi:hypothetical protein